MSRPVWQPERRQWSTTESAVFRTRVPDRFGPEERAHIQVVGDLEPVGWLTIPANGLSPDCEPHGGRCACGRSA